MRSTRSIKGLWAARPRGGKAVSALLLAGLAAWTVLAALLAGCAAETEVLRADAAFTAPALTGGKLVVVGVVQKDEIAQVRPPLIARLERVLATERSDIPLVRASEVGAALGDTPWRRLLNDYQALGTLDSASTAKLATALGGKARYAVVGRVVKDAMHMTDRELDRRDTTGIGAARYGRITIREARVDMQIYDLQTRLLVFRAEYIGSSENARYDRQPFVADLPSRPGGGMGMFGGGRGSRTGLIDSLRDELGFPDAPRLADAAEPAFRAFAQSLPRAAAGVVADSARGAAADSAAGAVADSAAARDSLPR